VSDLPQAKETAISEDKISIMKQEVRLSNLASIEFPGFEEINGPAIIRAGAVNPTI
jgi:hypothetical protein